MRANNAPTTRHVSYDTSRDKYQAELTRGSERHRLGRFHTAEEAALRDTPEPDEPRRR